MSDEEFRLDNPMLVRWEFASEERLEKRNALYKRLIDGTDPEDVLFNAIKEFAPTRWDFLGTPRDRSLGFSSANGAEQLARAFINVEAREANGVVVFATPDDMTQFVSANMTRAHLAAAVPDFSEPVPVRTHHTTFVAEKA